MVTTQHYFFVKFLFVIFTISTTYSGLAQNSDSRLIKITGFKVNNTTKNSATIKYLKPDENPVEEEVEVGSTFPYGTLFGTPLDTEITARTPEGYTITIEPGSKLVSDGDENGEEHRALKGKIIVSKTEPKKRSWWDRFKSSVQEKLDFFGGSSDEVQAAVEGTVFTVEAEGANVNIELQGGKLAIHKRTKIELNEKYIDIDTVPNRELFITEQTAELSEKNKSYTNNSDDLADRSLSTDTEIEKFFEDQFTNQTQILTKGGPESKLGFKLLEQEQDSLGILAYEKAIKNGELSRDRFIQASLILTEAYFRSDKMKNRSIWLDAALHFIELEHETNERKYNHFKAAGEHEASVGFGSDLVLSKKYFAWAYTVKLMITGCLEQSSQNPANWLDRAKKLNNSLN